MLLSLYILAVVCIFKSTFAVWPDCYIRCPNLSEETPSLVYGCNACSFTDNKMLSNMQHTVKKLSTYSEDENSWAMFAVMCLKNPEKSVAILDLLLSPEANMFSCHLTSKHLENSLEDENRRWITSKKCLYFPHKVCSEKPVWPSHRLYSVPTPHVGLMDAQRGKHVTTHKK